MPITFTAKVQEVLAVKVAPERLIRVVPAVAVMAPPPQLPVNPLGVATTRPAGRVSVNPTPDKEYPALLLVAIKVRVVDPFNGMDAAPKPAERVGAERTATLALEVLPVPPVVEVTVTLLFLAPAVVPVTFKEMVQLLPGLK